MPPAAKRENTGTSLDLVQHSTANRAPQVRSSGTWDRAVQIVAVKPRRAYAAEDKGNANPPFIWLPGAIREDAHPMWGALGMAAADRRHKSFKEER